MNKQVLSALISFFIIISTAQSIVKKRYSFVPGTFRAKVEQIIISTLSGKQKKTYGIIDYMYPGRFKYEQTEPSNNKIVFVSNSEKSWFYKAPFLEGRPGDLIINPLKGKFSLSEFFDLLSNGLSDNKMYKVKKEKGIYLLSFSGKYQKKIGFKKAKMIFKDKVYYSFGNLKTVQITKVNNKKVTFNMLDIKRNLKFKKSHFIFTPPPKTKINQ